MADIVTPEVRSRMMSGIRGKNTNPEILLRKALFARGFRYRLHVRKLPGTPDIVLPRYNAVVFVHGCFWHGHNCQLFRWPNTRKKFWREKISATRFRDLQHERDLKRLGWRCYKIWECSIRNKHLDETADTLAAKIRSSVSY